MENRVDAILETKYTLDEVLNFLDITEEEWKDVTNGVKIEVDEETGENICKVVDSEEGLECIQGDLMFIGFSDVEIVNAVCQDEKPDSNKEIDANYKVCDCGKWKEESEIVTANPVKVGNEWVYTWTFKKTGEVRNINESIKSRVKVQACTTAINEMIPNDIDKTIPKKDGSAYEPSADNSKYTICPEEGIKIPIGMKFTMHPNYIPKESVNRDLIWTSSDSSILSVQGSNPLTTCILNETYSNCFSKAIVTANKVGIAYVNVETTRGQTSSCKVEVFDGNDESVSCENLELKVGSSDKIKINYSPINATNLDFILSISDTSIAIVADNETGIITANKAGGYEKPENKPPTIERPIKPPTIIGCFLEGTKVLTSTGYKNIEEIKEGELVSSYNEKDDITEYKDVIKLLVHENLDTDLYEMIVDDEIIKVTGDHRFYIKNMYGIVGKWIAVKDIKIGDKVVDNDGKVHAIIGLRKGHYKGIVYNLSVSDNHNYYITESNYLVHNRKAMIM